ncbi:hypothetical protein EX30DRAFT_367281 [Ascodesmis nigricans]|uniref:BTB domain-containing protein n=1 Tax=Ascodesmis nigricans TaxID=341454 RepID=A0A4S2MI77_9PEZI|nr:hypothetical protein EX30DRAFT_367281 [Ascodesmis nigricans]
MSTLVSKLASLFLSPTHSDITILTGSTKFPAHLNILSLHTKYFQQHLTSARNEYLSVSETPGSSVCDVAEFGDEGGVEAVRVDVNPVVVLHEFAPEVVERTVEWCYRGEYAVKSEGGGRYGEKEERDEEGGENNENNDENNDGEKKPEAKQDVAIHVGVYYLAQLLKIQELSDYAVQKFRETAIGGPAEFEKPVKLTKEFGGNEDNMVTTVVSKLAETIWGLGSDWRDDWGLFGNYGTIPQSVVGELMRLKGDREREVEEKEKKAREELEEKEKKLESKHESDLNDRESWVNDQWREKECWSCHRRLGDGGM